MRESDTMDKLLPLFREFMQLDRKRGGEGVTPLEYQRWLDLEQKLAGHLSRPGRAEGERRRSARVSSRMQIEFKTPGHFERAQLGNVSRGGLFVATPFAAPVGTELELVVQIASTGATAELPCVVVSNNVGDGFSTATLGMGVRFAKLTPEQQSQVNGLLAGAIAEAFEDA